MNRYQVTNKELLIEIDEEIVTVEELTELIRQGIEEILLDN